MSDINDPMWDYYQSEALSLFHDSLGRLNFLLKKIPAGSKVLDIGVGSGDFERLALRKGIEIYSLDPSQRSIEKIRAELGVGDRAKVGYSQAIPFPNSFFDFVVTTEVLEHLPTEILAPTLKEISRVLTRKGRLLATVPSREDLKKSIVACPHCGERFHRWGHQQSFSPESLRNLVSPYLTVESVTEHKFITWSERRGIAKLVAAIKLGARYLGVRLPDETLFISAVNDLG